MSSRTLRGLAALLVIVPIAAVAQKPEPPEDDVTEEIIVTAQKRATNLQDVPFSVAALTAEDNRKE